MAPDLGRGVSRLQQDLVVQGLPEGVVGHGHRELGDAGDQVPRHPLLEPLFSSQTVLQLRREKRTLSDRAQSV